MMKKKVDEIQKTRDQIHEPEDEICVSYSRENKWWSFIFKSFSMILYKGQLYIHVLLEVYGEKLYRLCLSQQKSKLLRVTLIP